MRSECLQVEMGKRERERKGWRGLLYPLTQKRAVTALRPGMSGKIPKTLGSPETPSKTWILRPSKVSTQKISL
jgi:hypothetical protein